MSHEDQDAGVGNYIGTGDHTHITPGFVLWGLWIQVPCLWTGKTNRGFNIIIRVV